MAEFTHASTLRVARATIWIEKHRTHHESRHRGRYLAWPSRWEIGYLDGTLAPGGTATLSIWQSDLSADTGENTTVRGDAISESLPAQSVVIALKHRQEHWQVVTGGSAALVELCLKEDHPGRGIVFEAYLGVWDSTSHKWEYESGTGSGCLGAGTVKAIDWRYGAPYPLLGAKGLFIPRVSVAYGTIYECVSLDCESSGSCCQYGTGP